MKEITKILVYFAAVIVLGAILAPPLYWAGQWLASLGVLEFLSETEFQKFFNRAALVAAIALLWPTIRALRIRSFRELGLQADDFWGRHLLGGFAIAAGLVGLMAILYVEFGIYRWKAGDLPWGALPKLAITAITVAVLEECLFRGAIMGLFRRAMRPYAALAWTTAIFAILHFLKPEDEVISGPVTWFSGFELVPKVFHQFGEPMILVAGFSTLFVLGWLCGYAAMKTRSLWMSIGIHAGIVFVKMGFSKFTKRNDEYLPWVGSKLEIGLVPVAVLLLGLVIVWLWLRNENRQHRLPR